LIDLQLAVWQVFKHQCHVDKAVVISIEHDPVQAKDCNLVYIGRSGCGKKELSQT